MNKRIIIIIVSLMIIICLLMLVYIRKNDKSEKRFVNQNNIDFEEREEMIEIEPNMEEMEQYIDPITGKNVDSKTGKEI